MKSIHQTAGSILQSESKPFFLIGQYGKSWQDTYKDNITTCNDDKCDTGIRCTRAQNKGETMTAHNDLLP